MVCGPKCFLDRHAPLPCVLDSFASEFEFVPHAQRPVRADNPVVADGFIHEEIPFGEKLVQEVDERHASKVRVQMSAWLAHLAQQPPVCHNLVFDS